MLSQAKIMPEKREKTEKYSEYIHNMYALKVVRGNVQMECLIAHH